MSSRYWCPPNWQSSITLTSVFVFYHWALSTKQPSKSVCCLAFKIFYSGLSYLFKGFLGGSDGKASAYSAGDSGSIPGLGRSPGEGNGNPLQYCYFLEKEMATSSSTLAWKIPWMEKPGRLQSMGSQRVRHDWGTSLGVSEGNVPACNSGNSGSIPGWRRRK